MQPLYEYQARALVHVLSNPRCALFLEPGLGKTRISIEAIKQLPKPVLILAPKRVIDNVWPEELAKWAPELTWATMSDTYPRRAKAYAQDVDIYLLNYELLDKCLGASGAFKWKFKTLICDESTKIKNRATKIFKALRFNAAKISNLILLTGTPSPRSLEDLWAPVYLIDRGQRLGRTLTAFRDRWFIRGFTQWDISPRPSAQVEIQSLIKDVCLSMSTKDYLGLPPAITQDIAVDLPAAAQDVYRKLKQELTIEIEGEQITAVTATVMTNKLLQCASGAMYSETGQTVRIHQSKIEALKELIESLGDTPLLIVYQFKSELEALREIGVVELRDNKNSVDKWNRGEIPLLAIHPASAGHGLNLQHGSNHMVWTSPTYNLEHYDQTNARLHRNGQTKPVIIHRIIANKTTDLIVYKSLINKSNIQTLLMNSLR